ncbi:MAG: hypothetical protein QXW70_02550 [Candidatus Anstonellales archaeon]
MSASSRRTHKKRDNFVKEETVRIRPDFRSVSLLLESQAIYEDQLKEMKAISEIAKLDAQLRQQMKGEGQVVNIVDLSEISQTMKEAALLGERTEIKQSFLAYLKQTVTAMINWVLSLLRKRDGIKLTKRGKEALRQLKELASLLSIGDVSRDEISFEIAFGKAYYDIMSASYYAAKYNLKEDRRYVDGYMRAIESFVESVT